uniref:Tumor protein p53-inducible protein 13 n=1 Tax=Neogobius melanostomus TaxID=47308 RepID=A0A8C6TU32_9GOBI
MKERLKRTAVASKTNLPKISNSQTGKVTHNLQSNGLPETIPSQSTADQSAHLKENPLPKDLVSNSSQTTTNNIPVIHPEVQLQKSSGKKMGRNNMGNAATRSKVFKAIAKHRGGVRGNVASHPKDNTVINVEERDADHVNNGANPQQSDSNGSNSSSKSQPPGDLGVCQCKADQPSCGCGKGAGDQSQARAAPDSGSSSSGGFQRTPRTDEAVWAAGALAFLLVLLTLSILHTRLYKHWRRGTSLYWQDPQQDYDTVADVIRRRLRLTKKRRKRSRKKECVLLPSSSSSEDYP